jgi:RHH-type transcriptional regulator, proline utilization regulon repressor / proline dehydrogenase / delta 1-pyrroline-5-carboxylate dehydrogenase
VLGIVRAADLDEAIAIQNATGYGLTGGIHSLDDREVERWLSKVQVGNAYVNRHITGAIVQRQPFGGWKKSSVGPGAKAGGPHYVAQLGTWHETAPPSSTYGADQAVLTRATGWLAHADAADNGWVRAALSSDAQAWHERYGRDHDPSGLTAEANVFRYRPRRRVIVRVGDGAADRDVVRVVLAAVRSGTPVELSTPTPDRVPGLTVDEVVETDAQLVARVEGVEGVRVRSVGAVEDALREADLDCASTCWTRRSPPTARWSCTTTCSSRPSAARGTATASCATRPGSRDDHGTARRVRSPMRREPT